MEDQDQSVNEGQELSSQPGKGLAAEADGQSGLPPYDETILTGEAVVALYGSYARACIELNDCLDDEADEIGNFMGDGVDFFQFGLRDELLMESRRMLEWLSRHPHTVERCIKCAEPQNFQLAKTQDLLEDQEIKDQKLGR